MKVIKCELEDLPNHIATIEKYTHLYKIDIENSAIKDIMIRYTEYAYLNKELSLVPLKVVDTIGNTVGYSLFHHAKTMPTVIIKGGVFTDYGVQNFKFMDLLVEETFKSIMEYGMNKNITEFIFYQRMARSRFTNKIIKKMTMPGRPLAGWEMRVVAEIPPYGVVKDELLANWVVGTQYNGIVPERMTITQLTKIS